MKRVYYCKFMHSLPCRCTYCVLLFQICGYCYVQATALLKVKDIQYFIFQILRRFAHTACVLIYVIHIIYIMLCYIYIHTYIYIYIYICMYIENFRIYAYTYIYMILYMIYMFEYMIQVLWPWNRNSLTLLHCFPPRLVELFYRFYKIILSSIFIVIIYIKFCFGKMYISTAENRLGSAITNCKTIFSSHDLSCSTAMPWLALQKNY